MQNDSKDSGRQAGTPAATPGPTSAAVQAQSDDRLRRLRRRVLARTKPSAWVKDATVGGVAFVAIRITYVYLKALGAKPELLAAMGPKLIIDILGVCIVGVLGNRGLDLIGDLLTRFVDAFDSGINRMANSAERTAESAAETAIAQRDGAAAQREGAAAQRDLAVTQQAQTTVMEKVAAAGDRQLNEIQTVQNFQVAQGKLYLMEVKTVQSNQVVMHAALSQIAEKLGLPVQAKVEMGEAR